MFTNPTNFIPSLTNTHFVKLTGNSPTTLNYPGLNTMSGIQPCTNFNNTTSILKKIKNLSTVIKLKYINGIKNFGTVIENKVYRGACPTIKELKALAKRGAVIVDLRHDAPKEYKEQVLALGMEYINLPSYTPEETYHILNSYRRLDKIIKREKKLVFIHCGGGSIGTGKLVALYKILNGAAKKTAFINLRKHGGTDFEVYQVGNILNKLSNMGISVYNSNKT